MANNYSENFIIRPRDCGFDFEKYSCIYSNEFLDDIYSKLSVSHEDQDQVRHFIMSAACYYEGAKYNQMRQAPYHVEQTALKKLSKQFTKLEKLYLETMDIGSSMYMLTFALNDHNCAEGRHERAIRMLNTMFEGNSHYFKALPDLLATLADASQIAAENINTMYKPTNKMHHVSTWIHNISNIFTKHTKMPFTQGKYYKDIGYVSDCLDVLETIMQPLDPVITRQMLAEQIKIFNKKKTKKPA